MVQQVRDIYVRLEYVTTIAFLAFIGWYLFVFTPNVQVSSRLYVDGTQFTFVNFSHKTNMSSVLCDIPSQSILIFEDAYGNTHAIDDTAKRGTGDTDISRWEMSGRIPEKLEQGHVTVKKRLRYPCTFGITKTVDTAAHFFTLGEDGLARLSDEDRQKNLPNN